MAILEDLREVLAPRYGPHEDLVAPARARSALWRLGLGVAVVIALSLVGAQAVFLLGIAFLPDIRDAGLDPATGQTPGAMLMVLFSFVFASIGVICAARFLHKRDGLSLLGPMPRIFTQFLRTLLVLIGLWALIGVLPPYGVAPELERNMELGAWLHLLPLALLGVLVQVEAEELVFRGYLQQSLAARFNAPWVWMGVPSVLFALGHYLPAEAGENAVLIALWAGVFGLLMADLTARAGSLGPAIAVHLVNNVVALLILGTPGNLNGLALYLLPYELSDSAQLRPWLWVDFAMMLVSWLAARLAIRA